MRYRKLGATGLEVSELALGTVELGIDYGFKGSDHYTRPAREDAVRLAVAALDSGITLIDTARAYGEAEAVVGEALRRTRLRPVVATKLAITAATKASDVFESVERSLVELGVESVDLLQIHSGTAAALANDDAMGALEDVARQGKARFLGASVYTEEEALGVVGHGGLATLQAPFNLLDQSMAERAFPLAAERGVGVLVRSAFLRGVLTPQVLSLPEPLAPLREAAMRALGGEPVESLPPMALRFCLSFNPVSSVIVGVRTLAELEANLRAADLGPLDEGVLRRRAEFAVRSELASPASWGGLI
jgi:aryl-alcohol dehydrogenase-like predicted oxidoreductase